MVEKRFSLLPEMPTIEEAGVKGFDMSTWWGVVAPAGVSKEIVAKLHTEIVKATRTADAKEKIAFAGAEIVAGSADQMAAVMKTVQRLDAAAWIQDLYLDPARRRVIGGALAVFVGPAGVERG